MTSSVAKIEYAGVRASPPAHCGEQFNLFNGRLYKVKSAPFLNSL
jgi:hypothetical protein